MKSRILTSANAQRPYSPCLRSRSTRGAESAGTQRRTIEKGRGTIGPRFKEAV